jgi:hypothetical protein
VFWWKQDPVQTVDYAYFKDRLYRQKDPEFDANYPKVEHLVFV